MNYKIKLWPAIDDVFTSAFSINVRRLFSTYLKIPYTYVKKPHAVTPKKSSLSENHAKLNL